MKITILTEPLAKARARTVVKMGKVMSYTPKSTREAEAAIREDIVKQGYFFAAGVPLAVTMTFVITKPPSVARKRVFPVVKPDGDNYQKLLMDACNGYLWSDDAQVCAWTGRKVYGQPPRIELEVVSMTGESGILQEPLIMKEGRA